MSLTTRIQASKQARQVNIKDLKSHHNRTYFLYMIRYNISRPVHDSNKPIISRYKLLRAEKIKRRPKGGGHRSMSTPLNTPLFIADSDPLLTLKTFVFLNPLY